MQPEPNQSNKNPTEQASASTSPTPPDSSTPTIGITPQVQAPAQPQQLSQPMAPPVSSNKSTEKVISRVKGLKLYFIIALIGLWLIPIFFLAMAIFSTKTNNAGGEMTSSLGLFFLTPAIMIFTVVWVIIFLSHNPKRVTRFLLALLIIGIFNLISILPNLTKHLVTTLVGIFISLAWEYWTYSLWVKVRQLA